MDPYVNSWINAIPFYASFKKRVVKKTGKDICMSLRNEVNRVMRKVEADELCSKVKGSSNFWKIVKQMTKKERIDKRTDPVWNECDTLVYEDKADKDKVSTLNSFFATVLFAEIYSWCNSKKLTLHTGESEVMILQRNIFVGPYFLFNLETLYLNTPIPLGCSNWYHVALEGPSAWNVQVILYSN